MRGDDLAVQADGQLTCAHVATVHLELYALEQATERTLIKGGHAARLGRHD